MILKLKKIIKFILLLFFLINTNLYSVSNHNFSYYGSGISDKEENTENQNVETNGLLQYKFQTNQTYTNYGYDIDLNLLLFSKKMSDPKILLGDNAFGYLKISDFQILFGRKIFTNEEFSHFFSDWKDGSEGFLVNFKPNSSLQFNLILIDFYRGFSSLEQNTIYRENVSSLDKNFHYRGGANMTYSNQYLHSFHSLLYLNFGNWGKFSKDNEETKNIGDEDYLIEYNTKNILSYSHFKFYINAIITRGMDKALNSTVREEQSYSISGELIASELTYSFQNIELGGKLFIPDTDERNKNGEILNIGFIGLGTNPIDSFLFSQIYNFHPSAWVTENGLEKNDSFRNGNRSFAFANLFTKIRIKFLTIEPSIGYGVFRKWEGFSKGYPSINKNDYEKDFILNFQTNVRADFSSKFPGFIQIQFQQIQSSKGLGLNGSGLMISSGVQL